MFILRAAFWLSIVVLMLPADPGTGAPAPRVSAIEAIGAAQAAIGDISLFCDRNPDVCATGATAFQLFTQKVRYGADLIRDYFDGSPGGDTLDGGDRAPVWRGLEARGGVV